jgi:hypothetical protein
MATGSSDPLDGNCAPRGNPTDAQKVMQNLRDLGLDAGGTEALAAEAAVTRASYG